MVEDPARNQKLCVEMIRKLKSKVYSMRRKKGQDIHRKV